MNRSDERGIVLLNVIVVVAMLGALTFIASTSLIGSAQDTKAERNRDITNTITDSAVELYQFMLNANMVTHADQYVPSAAMITRALSAGGSTTGGKVVSTSTAPAEFQTALQSDAPIGTPVTVQVQDGFWQIVSIDPPDAASGTLRVWVRSWMGTTPRRTRYTRLDYTPGAFTNWQLLVNRPVTFGGDVTFGGKVHVNGYAGSASPAISAAPGATVRCSGPDGEVTVATSTPLPSVDASCNAQLGARPISFTEVQTAIDDLRDECGTSAAVQCFLSSTGGHWDVDLQGTDILVTPASGGTVHVDATAKLGLLFEGNVTVRGYSNARNTIVAALPRGTVATGSTQGDLTLSGGADIRLADDTGSDPSNLEAVLGLVAQGNVIVDPQAGSCATNGGDFTVRAAIVAQQGTLTLDPKRTTSVYQSSGLFRCNAFVLQGTLAAQTEPLLRWNWKDAA